MLILSFISCVYVCVVHQWDDGEACVFAEWHAPAQHQDQAAANVTQPWGHETPGGQLV